MSFVQEGFGPVIMLIFALFVDLVLGEAPNAVHPVVWIGGVTRALVARAPKAGAAVQFAFGSMIVAVVPVSAALVAGWTMRVVPPLVAGLVGIFFLKSTFALRALGSAALEVRDALRLGALDAARFRLRSLCSRDASTLDGPLVAAGAVESLAENLSDSFVGPLLYYALFGLPGAVFYRSVNTLDSMIGYHGRFEYLGKASARLDDLLNFVPARLTAGFLIAGGALLGLDARAARMIIRRDGGKTESPNAGRPMAAMAGLLGVELEKVGHYRLGDARVAMDAEKIGEAWRVVRMAAALSVVAAVLGLLARAWA